MLKVFGGRSCHPTDAAESLNRSLRLDSGQLPRTIVQPLKRITAGRPNDILAARVSPSFWPELFRLRSRLHNLTFICGHINL